MVVTSNTAGVSVPNNTTIVSISSNTAVLSNNVSGTGTPTFSAIGPSDTAADGGGIILDGTTDHTFTWSNANDAWQSSENMDLANNKTYNIIDGSGNARQMLSLTQIGPTAGTGVVAGLGSGVTSSVLTSVGTLTSLDVSGNTTLSGNITQTTSSNGQGITINGANNSSALTFDANRGTQAVLGVVYGRWNGTTVAQMSFVSGDDGTNKNDGFITFGTESSASNGNVNAQERLRIAADGKVGINLVGSDNESPVRNLDIADSSGAIIRLKSTDDSLGANERLGEIEFYTDDDDGGHIGAFVKAIADPSDTFGRRTALTFGTQSSDNPPGDAVEVVRINASGYVGINETDPRGFLDVRSTTDLGSIFRRDYGGVVSNNASKLAMTIWGQDHDQSVSGSTGTDQYGPMIGFGGRADDAVPNIADIRAGISYSYNGDLTFHAKSGSNSGLGITDGSHERLRIDGNTGNLLIGTNNTESYHNAKISVSANTAKLLELRSSGTGLTDTNYVKRFAQSFTRGTTEGTFDILTLENVSGNSHVVIELKMYAVSATESQAGIITAYANAKRLGADSGYTLGQLTPTINFIIGTGIAVGSLAWTSNGAGGGTLKYTTNSNNNYTKYNCEITIWAHDRAKVSFP